MLKNVLTLLAPGYPWGQEIQYYEEISSTNTSLKAMARNGAPEGTALIARRQTGGRGRLGRSFQSEDGGVYLSLLLRPQCSPEDLMHLTCAVAVAMCDAVEAACGLRPGIKWTNDLVYGRKKLGGILTELGFGPKGEVDYCILGIGINCAQREEDFSPELRDMAASLTMVTGKPLSPDVLAARMLEKLHEMSAVLLSEKAEILNRYRENCVTLGQEVSVLRADTVRHGRALEITDTGALVVEYTDGTRDAVNSGEVSIRGMYGYL